MTNIENKAALMVTVVAIVTTIARAGHSADNACPSADDTAYSTQVGETWYALGGRAYCLDGPSARTRAALALFEYNRGRVGSNVGKLPDGVTVCLPKFLHGPFFDAERCRSAPVPDGTQSQPTRTPASAPTTAICGNGLREENELCDGADLSGATCATFNLPTGTIICRADCRGFDAKACIEVQKPDPPHVETPRDPEGPKRPDQPRKPTPLSLAVDVAGGVMFPLAEKQRTSFYGAMGLARAGGRFGVGPIELALHGVSGGGGSSTLFNGVESDLRMFVAGAEVQTGVPISRGPFRVTPGVEAVRLWMSRIVEMPLGYRPARTEQTGGMSFVGAFLRTEYRFQRFPHLVASIDVALDLATGEVANFSRAENFQMKTFGGVSYAAF